MNQEVAVKALIGKGRRYLVKDVEIEVNKNASKALGCWIINHQCESYYRGRELFVKGSYDVEVWIAIDNDQKTEVKRVNVTFDEKISSAYKELPTLNDELYLKTIVLHYPTCSKMELKDDKVFLTVESEYLIDVFAETILVVVCAKSGEEDLSIDEQIVMNVDPEYLRIGKKKKS